SAALKYAVEKRDAKLLNALLKISKSRHEHIPGLILDVVKISWDGGLYTIRTCLGSRISLTLTENTLKILSSVLVCPDDYITTTTFELFSSREFNPEKMLSIFNQLDIKLEKHFHKLFFFIFERIRGNTRLNFSLQMLTNQLLQNSQWRKYPEFTKQFIEYSISRVEYVRIEKETAMCLLQLSQKIQDYRLASIIKNQHTSTQVLKTPTIPFSRKWITDPVTRDFLADMPDKGFMGKSVWLGKKFVSSINPLPKEKSIDAASLSNDLIFALQEPSTKKTLRQVFADHKISGLTSKALEHLLVGLITELYPDPSKRSSMVCRMMIGYCLSTISDDTYFSEHQANQLMQSDEQWQSMRQKVAAEIEALDEVGLTIIDSVIQSLSSERLVPLVTRIILENLDNPNAESELRQDLQSSLGLLDIPARRLTEACLQAGRLWLDRQPSSASHANTRLNMTSVEDFFRQVIGRRLTALRQQPKLPDQLSNSLEQLDVRLASAFHQMVFFQLDLISQAFGVFQPIPGDTISNLVDQLGKNGQLTDVVEMEITPDADSSTDQRSESSRSAYLDSEDSFNPSH
ncbi:MAG: hypothetical protein ACKO5Z_07925, partial [Burkholderiaceae bacterium]